MHYFNNIIFKIKLYIGSGSAPHAHRWRILATNLVIVGFPYLPIFDGEVRNIEGGVYTTANDLEWK